MATSASPKSQLNVRVADETRQLLELAAACEGRPMGVILGDAIRWYVRSHSDGYRAYLDVARRFLDAPAGSEEEAHARAALAAGVKRQRGIEPDELSGDALAVLARLR